MTYNILNDCLTIWHSAHEEDKNTKLTEYFSTINVHTFDKLLTKSNAATLVMFVVLGYSEGSPMVVLKQDSVEEKRNICKYLGVIEGKEVDNIAYLRDKELKEAATDYLVAFCGEEFRAMMFCKIQLADYDYDITNRQFREGVVESTGDEDKPTKIEYTYDIKEHNRAVMERAKLAKEIEKMEREQMQKNKHKFTALNDLEDWIRRGGVKSSTKKRNGHPEALIKRVETK